MGLRREEPTRLGTQRSEEAVADKGSAKSVPKERFARARGTFGSGGWGLGGAALVSLCCAPTAIAFALGLGGSAFLVGLARYELYFVLAGLAVVAVAGWRMLRPGGGDGCCVVPPLRTRIYRFALMVAVFGGSYLAINYLLLPRLFGIS